MAVMVVGNLWYIRLYGYGYGAGGALYVGCDCYDGYGAEYGGVVLLVVVVLLLRGYCDGN